jgi:hypothetical protein
MIESLIPSNELCIKAWWFELLSGEMTCGYGGARAPLRPIPLRVPNPHTAILDYREQIRFAIAHHRNRVPLGKINLTPKDGISISMRNGTSFEPIGLGSVYVLQILGKLISIFADFYATYREGDFRLTPALLRQLEQVVKLRLLMVATNSHAYIPTDIDNYIVNELVGHLPRHRAM